MIHVRMSTYPAPEGFAWSSVPELAPGPPPISTATVAVAGSPSDSSSWGPAPAAPAVVPAAAEKKPAAEKKRKPATKGIFAPLVTGAKALMGEEELNKLRGEVIAQHSKVISAFVDTSESPFGQLVIRKMFEAADKDGSGGVDKEELRAALKALGFDFLEEKQVSGILERADTSGDEVIDFEEFVKETPRCAHHRRNPHRLFRPPPRRVRPPFCFNRLTGCVVTRFAPKQDAAHESDQVGKEEWARPWLLGVRRRSACGTTLSTAGFSYDYEFGGRLRYNYVLFQRHYR